ncbi:unnamed protein product, partial [Ilex paraguariensis]
EDPELGRIGSKWQSKEVEGEIGGLGHRRRLVLGKPMETRSSKKHKEGFSGDGGGAQGANFGGGHSLGIFVEADKTSMEGVEGSGAMERGAYGEEGRGDGSPQGMGEPMGGTRDATDGTQLGSQDKGNALSFLGTGPTWSGGGFNHLGADCAREIGRNGGA